MTAILWTADRDGHFAVPQAEWESYTGHGWDRHQGDGWLEAVHADDRPRVRESWAAALHGLQVFEAEMRLYSKAHAGYRFCVARAAPLLEADGEVREWIGHVADVHDSKMAE